MERPSRTKDIIIGVLCFIVGALVSYAVLISIGNHALSKAPQTVAQIPSQTANGTAGSTTGPQNAGFTITQDPNNPDQNIFTSSALGLSFSYLKYGWSYDESNPGIDRSTMANPPTLSGNTISFGPNYKDSLTVYPKDPDQSLESAIQSQFLGNIPATQCIVVRVQDGSTTSVYQPTNDISYVTLSPVSSGGCPSQFDFTNPTAAFFSFADEPDKFFYVAGEQDGTIPLITATGDPFWTTMTFTDQE